MATPGWKVTVLAAHEKLKAVTTPSPLRVRVIQRPGRKEARVNMRRLHSRKNDPIERIKTAGGQV
jgi:hypothetical protein